MNKNYLLAYNNLRIDAGKITGAPQLPATLDSAFIIGIDGLNSFQRLASYAYAHSGDGSPTGILCERLVGDLISTQDMTGITYDYIDDAG